MPKLDLESVPQNNRTGYPPPYDAAVKERWVRRLSPVIGFSDFGASHVTLKPGAASSQRHWHEQEDELVVMLTGAAVLVDDHGRTPMKAGDIAVFPKNDGNGHCLVNESEEDCVFVAIGKRPGGLCHYPDIDLMVSADMRYTHRDGTPY